ncbi:single-stranded DNA-binding protein [Microbacterium hominis]|uniref:Single-stranded DNA-binding protein n=1 Tax=Microbacterium hominis TaxID=162426 RepID=A0A7D4TGG7_9MICO|nr:single-stranded DNA-binding protein [Microbacterium hominis]QKJ19321.1 single-stranded DNA-binding protein [Microbacterium hominis]
MNAVITISGNVATQPESRANSAGMTIANFRVACNERRFDRASGQWVSAGTSFYTVSAFRSLGDHVLHSVKKGDPVIVSGRLRVREWDNGERRGTAVDIEAEAVGHDLRWGTAVYSKRPGSPSPTPATGTDQRAESDGWAAPGLDEATWAVAAVGDGADAAPAEAADAAAPADEAMVPF